MNRKILIMIAGLSCAATFALAGCSGSGTPATEPAGSSPSRAASSAPASSAPASSPSDSTAPSSAASSASDDSDDAGKPSKSDIVDGLTKFYTTTQGLTEAKAKKFATCMVDQMYDKASAKTLKAMEAGDPTKIDTKDGSLLGEAGVACADALK